MIATTLLLAALGPCADLSACTAKVRAPAELLTATREALKLLRLPEGEPKQPAPKLDAKTLRGDVAFSLEVEPEGGELIVRALSLHRPPSVFGRARVKPQPLPKPEQRAKATQLALRSGIEQAMTDLQAQLAEGAGQGRRHLRLSVRVSGLDRISREQARDVYLPCLKGEFDALGAVTEPREVAGYLEDEVEYAPVKDEPRDPLAWQAARLLALTVGPKARCPAPQKSSASVRADPLNHGVIIELR